jgi:hypothetical protein
MPDFGIMRGFNEKLFGDKLVAGQLPTQLGLIGSVDISLLLDAYPNAAAAYSLRKLRTAYTGSAIRVRRSSDNTEQDIGFSGENLDTAALTSFCGSGDGFVTTWYDQSGNANNITQSTAAKQPQILLNGNLYLNQSKPYIFFSDSAINALSANMTLNYTAFSIFAVANKIATGNFRAVFSRIISFFNATFDDYQDITTNYLAMINSGFIRAGIDSIKTDVSYSFNQYHIINQIRDNSLNINNVGKNNVITNGIFAGSLNSSTLKIGNNKAESDCQFNGYITEIILYPSNQTNNIDGINTNININYGIY